MGCKRRGPHHACYLRLGFVKNRMQDLGPIRARRKGGGTMCFLYVWTSKDLPERRTPTCLSSPMSLRTPLMQIILGKLSQITTHSSPSFFLVTLSTTSICSLGCASQYTLVVRCTYTRFLSKPTEMHVDPMVSDLKRIDEIPYDSGDPPQSHPPQPRHRLPHSFSWIMMIMIIMIIEYWTI